MGRPLYRVVREHKASFNYTMVARDGDLVSVGREDPEMPGWFWCRDARGVEMWVPSTHIHIEGRKAIFNQFYNSTELEAKVGDVVQVLGETLGWAEVLGPDWRYGWIPRDKLAPV